MHYQMMNAMKPLSSLQSKDCVSAIGLWMTLDKLNLNEKNTEVVLIGVKQQLTKIRKNHTKDKFVMLKDPP